MQLVKIFLWPIQWQQGLVEYKLGSKEIWGKIRDFLIQMWEGFSGLHLDTVILWAGADCLRKHTKAKWVWSTFSSCRFLPSHQLWRIANWWANCIGAVERLQLQSATRPIHWTSPVNVSIAPWKLDRIHCVPLLTDNKGFCWAGSAKVVLCTAAMYCVGALWSEMTWNMHFSFQICSGML